MYIKNMIIVANVVEQKKWMWLKLQHIHKSTMIKSKRQGDKMLHDIKLLPPVVYMTRKETI